MSTFLTFDHTDGRRWWVLRRPHGAVSLTAVLIPDGTPTLTTEIADRDGGRLMPDCITVHAPGPHAACPALEGGCDGDGEALLGARQLLERWSAAGYDDAVIVAALTEVYDREVTA